MYWSLVLTINSQSTLNELFLPVDGQWWNQDVELQLHHVVITCYCVTFFHFSPRLSWKSLNPELLESCSGHNRAQTFQTQQRRAEQHLSHCRYCLSVRAYSIISIFTVTWALYQGEKPSNTDPYSEKWVL